MALLRDVDTEFGHVIKNSDAGVVYEDDGSPVDDKNPRPCFGCGLSVKHGEPDPCIAGLPSVKAACCGHGRACSATGGKSGYVAFDDGRVIRFPGDVGSASIRRVVDVVLNGGSAPEGFTFDETRMWWDGLTEAQCSFVRSNMRSTLERLVRAATDGAGPSQAFLDGTEMWWDGLSEAQKDSILDKLGPALIELSEQAKTAA